MTQLDQNKRLREALEEMQALVIEYNRAGATWPSALFGKMMAALAKTQQALAEPIPQMDEGAMLGLSAITRQAANLLCAPEVNATFDAWATIAKYQPDSLRQNDGQVREGIQSVKEGFIAGHLTALAHRDGEVERLKEEIAAGLSIVGKLQEERDQLRTELANEKARGVHSCHDDCTRDGCVNVKLRAQLAECKADAGSLQARIDELMLEYCPEEMTPEQIKAWGERQKPVSEDLQKLIDATLTKQEGAK